MEARRDQRLLEARADHRLAVQALDCEAGEQAVAGRGRDLADRLGERLARQIRQAQDAAAAALDEQEWIAVAKQDICAGGPAGATPALALGP